MIGREARVPAWTAGTMAVLGVGFLVWAVTPLIRQRVTPPAPAASFGVAARDAGCDPELTDPVSGKGIHVGDGTRVAYETVPPSSGPHHQEPAPLRRFYARGEAPAMEHLVHNLEHGYTVVWYTAGLPAEQAEALRGLAEVFSAKFVAAPWDDTYGTFPPGRRVGVSRWGSTAGYRLLCESVSGTAIERFMQAHPASDAPEPEGA
jgi:hypothetical protein